MKLTIMSTTNTQPSLAAIIFDSPVGKLLLKANSYGLTHLTVTTDCEYEKQNLTASDAELSDEYNRAVQHVNQTREQLSEYFDGKRTSFDLALAPKGTEFQHQVWQALVEVNYGASCSYSDIANKINRPKAVRAVGAANGANPIAIIVPCHRIIGKSGKLTGYAYGLKMKQSLLDLEAK
ncbi:methylated-DNA--[protein]-cysteine S-methyltransferase [Parashewanella spongiae]|uniref:Methylated-DNA--protein-cysteine methyltransferase n=1 Tax=Parashewanella spongiae TaxID=342950 RepID=A0A3A6TV10_9GAMM|nr:methylated-DNA--[protein]-cysteine S-methyltransferase [Parashewanella spongiae]